MERRVAADRERDRLIAAAAEGAGDDPVAAHAAAFERRPAVMDAPYVREETVEAARDAAFEFYEAVAHGAGAGPAPRTPGGLLRLCRSEAAAAST